METAPTETLPVEPDPPSEEEPGFGDPATTARPVDRAPAALAVAVVGAALAAGAGGIAYRRRRTATEAVGRSGRPGQDVRPRDGD